MSKANFDDAIKFTLVNEGGYSNVPEDSGGPTNFGITQGDYAAFKGHPVTAAEVKAMPLTDAKIIYKTKYWKESFEGLEQAIATCIFDWGVLHGTLNSRKLAQQVANSLGAKLTVDGVIGPFTVAAINKIDVRLFVTAYAGQVLAWFNQRVIDKPSQKVFLKGWTQRANRLLTLIPKAVPPVVIHPEPINDPIDILARAPWVTPGLPYLGLNEVSSVLSKLLVPWWAKVHLPGFKSLIGGNNAWCSLFVDWAVNQVGIKGTANAMALSWRTWGVSCPYWFGAILGLKHASGGGHVTIFLYWVDEKKKLAACLGGNQSNQLNITVYNLSGNKAGHDEVINGPRWPKGWTNGQFVTAEQVKAVIRAKENESGSTR